MGERGGGDKTFLLSNPIINRQHRFIDKDTPRLRKGYLEIRESHHKVDPANNIRRGVSPQSPCSATIELKSLADDKFWLIYKKQALLAHMFTGLAWH